MGAASGTSGRALYGAIATIAAAHLVPSVTAAARVRRFVPAIAGVGDPGHVALTFDDGPDPASTPAFLDALADLGVRATFFVLGAQLAANPELGHRLLAAGHEVAVHGWSHRPHLLRSPAGTVADLRRSVECVARATGERPRFWRPPHGIPTGTGIACALRLGMRPVLWTADGRDWRADASAASVLARIEPDLRGGGVVLLHDSDVTSAPLAWRSALGALPGLVAWCRARGLRLGPLAEHGLAVPGRKARHAVG